jgi:UDP-2,4-diacetamido-2,4,6-trideoxy-beta-L-altropyranose hydrolase
MSSLFIRADANTQIGMGHVMRCLALAQAWQETGGAVHFALANVAPAIESRLRDEGLNVYYLTAQPGSDDDANQTITLARQIQATWVVVDGYHFDADYQRALKQADLRLLVVDDYGHANHYYADLVLNQNIYAEESLYTSREPYTHLLLGTQYALLRREFWPWRGWRREIAPVARKVLVTLGGADPDNVTLKVIRVLQQTQLEGLEAVVVVGNSNPHWETLQAAVNQQTESAIRLEQNVTHMPELMTWADVAISAGGSTCWELAFMGLPNLVMVLADNQRLVAEGLNTAGVSVNLGNADLLSPNTLIAAFSDLANSPKKRFESIRCSQMLVDGAGADRVVRQMQGEGLTLRPVEADDCHLIWVWANDPNIRSNSFSSEPIPWETHQTWFKAKLADPLSFFYLALDSTATPIGQVRFQINQREAVISVSLASEYRRQGYGSQIIKLGSQHVFASTKISQIHAYVKPDNSASIRAFTKAGFTQEGARAGQEERTLHLLLEKGGQP